LSVGVELDKGLIKTVVVSVMFCLQLRQSREGGLCERAFLIKWRMKSTLTEI